MTPDGSYDWCEIDEGEVEVLERGERVTLLAPSTTCAVGDELRVHRNGRSWSVRVVRVDPWVRSRDWVVVRHG